MPTGKRTMLPGFELLYSSVQSQLRSPQDAVVSVIHWNIISAGFKLIGVGENPTGDKQCTEVLPSGWNVGEIYVLHYETSSSEPKQKYLLKILPVDGSLLVYFQRENEENVTTLELPVQEFVTDNLSSVSTAFRDIDALSDFLRQSLIDPAMGNKAGNSSQDGQDKSKAAGTSSSEKSKEKKKEKSSLLVEERRPRPMQPVWYGDQGMGGMGGGMGGMDPFSVGRADLDPLAGFGGMGGGGGMIMDPRHSGGPRFGPEPGGGFGGPSRGGGIHPGALPPGAIPPGARFDPYGPPGTRPGPDPDHERPPGYDDMYM